MSISIIVRVGSHNLCNLALKRLKYLALKNGTNTRKTGKHTLQYKYWSNKWALLGSLLLCFHQYDIASIRMQKWEAPFKALLRIFFSFLMPDLIWIPPWDYISNIVFFFYLSLCGSNTFKTKCWKSFEDYCISSKDGWLSFTQTLHHII